MNFCRFMGRSKRTVLSTAVMTAALCVACSDDGVGSLGSPFDTDVVTEEGFAILDFNDSGEALLRGTSTVLWDGQEFYTVPIPLPRSLGPDGAVLGASGSSALETPRVLYWKEGTLTDIGEGSPLGIVSSTGAAYYRLLDGSHRVYRWVDGALEEVGDVPSWTTLVGKDGTLYGSTFVSDGSGMLCWALVEGVQVEIDRDEVDNDCDMVEADLNLWATYTLGTSSRYRSLVWHQGDEPRVIFWYGTVDVNGNGEILTPEELIRPTGQTIQLSDLLPEGTVVVAARINNVGQLLVQTSERVLLLTPKQ